MDNWLKVEKMNGWYCVETEEHRYKFNTEIEATQYIVSWITGGK